MDSRFLIGLIGHSKSSSIPYLSGCEHFFLFRFLLCAILAAVSCLLQFFFFISPILFLFSCDFVRLFFFNMYLIPSSLSPPATQSIARAPFNVTKHSPNNNNDHTQHPRIVNGNFPFNSFNGCAAHRTERDAARDLPDSYKWMLLLPSRPGSTVRENCKAKWIRHVAYRGSWRLWIIVGLGTSDETLVYEENCNNTWEHDENSRERLFIWGSSFSREFGTRSRKCTAFLHR